MASYIDISLSFLTVLVIILCAFSFLAIARQDSQADQPNGWSGDKFLFTELELKLIYLSIYLCSCITVWNPYMQPFFHTTYTVIVTIIQCVSIYVYYELRLHVIA